MKKVLTVIMLTLAMNFLAAAGGVGWLYGSGRLNKGKIMQMRELIFAPPAQPANEASALSSTRPSLDDLMAQQSGRSATEKVEFIQRTFDTRMLELDRRQTELADLQSQVDLANQKLSVDRKALEKEKQAVAAKEKEAQTLQTDQGFQDSLAVYNSIPPKQVKDIFLNLDQQTVRQYLEAMDARQAGKIVKEFKTPVERAFILKVLESMREVQASSTDGKQQP
jgi:flagellar motility protein MotE (MotC chaperone)